ncbi:MAG: fibronectin type III domain-containing protein, partial [Oscillospiraceae bacterium]
MLVRYVDYYISYEKTFTSIDLVNNVQDNAGINYLNERKTDNNIWLIDSYDAASDKYIYKTVSGGSFDAGIIEYLNTKPAVKATSTANSVRLSWKAVPKDEKYAVYKYVDGKAVKLAETKKLAVRITKLIPDTEYQYIVRAYVDGEWTKMK